jgi:hypothetical protein
MKKEEEEEKVYLMNYNEIRFYHPPPIQCNTCIVHSLPAACAMMHKHHSQ